jgi:hypothetical protein
MLEATKSIVRRVNLILKPVEETWDTLPEPEQTAWHEFFKFFTKNLLDVNPEENPEEATKLAGALSYIWAIAHEYQKAYGPLWK